MLLEGIMKNTDQKETTNTRKDYERWRGCLKKQKLEQKFLARRHPDIHWSKVAEGGGK
jgi:hypothetical protein